MCGRCARTCRSIPDDARPAAVSNPPQRPGGSTLAMQRYGELLGPAKDTPRSESGTFTVPEKQDTALAPPLSPFGEIAAEHVALESGVKGLPGGMPQAPLTPGGSVTTIPRLSGGGTACRTDAGCAPR